MKAPQLLQELEENTAALWVSQGSIVPTWYGNENTYYINEFGHEMYCKNYPTEYGKPFHV